MRESPTRMIRSECSLSRPLFEAGSGGVVRHLPKFGRSWLAEAAGLLLLLLLPVPAVAAAVRPPPPSLEEERPCVRSEVGCIRCF
jgi:hypothetical protein